MKSGKNILLATYNFYPFHWGGSEVYVKGLAHYLAGKGYHVVVAAAVPGSCFDTSLALYEDQILRATTYTHDGIRVLGAQLKNESTLSIYAKYAEGLADSWKNCLVALFPGHTWYAVHLHGYTGLINTALFEAAKGISVGCRACFSYHTPVSCPKGTLLYFGKGQCGIRPDVNTCTACVLHDRSNLPERAARTLAAALPANLSPRLPLPTAFRIKALVKASIGSVDRLRRQAGRWYVFSHQVGRLLERNGVAPARIRMIRHGVEDGFLAETTPRRAGGDKSTFVYIGRFEKIKGFATLLNAWLALPPSPERELCLVGENQNGDREIAALLSAAQARPDIVLAGKKNRSEIEAILRAAHCVVIPSEWVETGPLVFHEAIACGCNVIAANLGGTRELAEYYGDGCELFNFRDEADLGKKLTNFSYRDVSRAASLALSQRRHYEQVEAGYATAG